MEDLIRRSDAISRKGVSAWLDNMGYPRLANAVMDEKRFPSADRPQEWIPCSERLPNKQSDYLVTISLYDNSTYVDVLHFHKGKFYEIDSEWGDVEYDDVTAWMPLPKPWKGADDE